ncbi:MAG: hypothetical protein R2882_01765 [Gemmatimonadales bacterium]
MRQVAYIPEQVNLIAITGLENLAYFAALGGREGGDDGLLELFDQVGLGRDAARRRVSTYSGDAAEGGNRDRPGPSGKGPSARRTHQWSGSESLEQLLELLAMLRSREVAILMATHDLFRARQSGTRVGIMRRGVGSLPRWTPATLATPSSTTHLQQVHE